MLIQCGFIWKTPVTVCCVVLCLVVVLLGSSALLHGCGSRVQRSLDVTAPYTFATPAGGIYSTLPAQIRLQSEDNATLYYRWQEGKEQQYTGPIRVPEPHTGRHTLYFGPGTLQGARHDRVVSITCWHRQRCMSRSWRWRTRCLG